MNDIPVNNWAAGLALFSFAFLSGGSILFGATVTTALLRGLGGGILFGSLLWMVGVILSKDEESIEETILEDEGALGTESTQTKDYPTESQDK